MLAAGRSRPWPQTLYHLTGEREMTASAILEYFAPLQQWLVKYRLEKGYTIGWKKRKMVPSPVVNGARKTLSSTKSNSSITKPQVLLNKTRSDLTEKGSKPGNNNGTADVSFPEVKKNDDAINLGKPDLKAALAAMGPVLKTSEENSSKDKSLLDPKSDILGAKPMFVPNKIKDQLVLG